MRASNGHASAVGSAPSARRGLATASRVEMSDSSTVGAATYAIVQDVAASWEHYERFAVALAEAVPEGLIVHVAGRTDEGFRIIGIWETEEAWRRFADRLEPAGGSEARLDVFRPLHLAHVVYGGREEQ